MNKDSTISQDNFLDISQCQIFFYLSFFSLLSLVDELLYWGILSGWVLLSVSRKIASRFVFITLCLGIRKENGELYYIIFFVCCYGRGCKTREIGLSEYKPIFAMEDNGQNVLVLV